MSYPPNANNAPLEFGNRLGHKLTPPPPPPPDRSSRDRSSGGGGRAGGLLAAGGYRSDSNGASEFNGRRNDGGRRSHRDDSRSSGSMLGQGGQSMLQPLMGPQSGQSMPMGLLGSGPQDQAPGSMGSVGPTPVWDVPVQGMQQGGNAAMMGGGGGPNMGGMGYNMGGEMGNNMAYNMAPGSADPNMVMGGGTFNMLPAGMPQPLYPQLPGTWMPDGNFVPIKETIVCAECILEPPNPSARPPMTRERPNGCRTAFIGGLPEKITEEILRDVFQRCGEIQSLRMSQKNFAHVRFVLEVYVDYAIMLSGYRMKIRGETDGPHTGRIHVDYAQARDDQYEWECQQRVLQREMRHRQRQFEEMNRQPSPPPVSHYSHHEALSLMEKIKEESTFNESVLVLTQWLERGDCNKRTAGNFYSMIQSTNSHVRRLMGERTSIDEELARMKEQARLRQQQIIIQFGQIESVFVAASQQKVWDHFSKAQRKNIELWKKQAMEIKKMHLEELQGGGDGAGNMEEMELSDGEDDQQLPAAKKRPRKADADDEQDLASAAAAYAQQEMSAADYAADAEDALRCQMEAYKNEAEMARFEHKEELEAKEKEMDIMRTTMQNVQKQLLASRTRESALEKQLRQLRARVAKMKLSAAGATGDAENTEGAEQDADLGTDGTSPALLDEPIDGQDSRIIGLASAFLNVHPDGASPDYIWSYLQQFPGYAGLASRDVETVLARYDRVFKENVSGVGAKMERKWVFIGYTPQTGAA